MLVPLLALLPCVAAKTTTWRHLRDMDYAFPFDNYLAEYGKSYASQPEYLRRKTIFEAALVAMKAHNEAPGKSWKMGLSAHTDKSPEEWQSLKGYRAEIGATSRLGSTVESPSVDLASLPDSVDWREKNVVTPVKDQGGCGSCWAFSATEVFESALAVATGELIELAPQELVDCAPNPKECGGTGGCEGSVQWLGFNYTMTAGFALESAYPYKGTDGACKMGSTSAVAQNTGYERLPANDYGSLMQAVASIGPIAVSVDASWGGYEEGVYDSSCGSTIDHAVVLVGYGHDEASGHDYWLVRNSWGTSWGEDGYIRIQRFGEGQEPCKVDTHPAEGTGCKGGPKTQTVCGLCGILSDSSYPTGLSKVGA